MAETVVLLHGFAGTRHGWDLVAGRLRPERYRPLALDLRGHGDARDVRPIDFAACTADVAAAAPERFVLCGYSMGGRVALHAAAGLGDRVRRLVLIGASPGIADAAERAARAASDAALADRIEAIGIEAFAAEWEAQPLLAGMPRGVAELAGEDRRRNTAAGLAAALRGLGTGVMPSLWERLPDLDLRVDLVVGERDEKFRAIAEKMAYALPHATVTVVPGAGHAPHLEAPDAVVEVLAG